MSCLFAKEERTELLLAYCAGKLESASTAELELHMKTCAECAAVGRTQSVVWEALAAWNPEAVSADFDARLYARIDAAASAPWYQRAFETLQAFVRPLLAQPALPLAAAGLVVVGGFLLDHPASSLPVTSSVASNVSAVEAEQMERTLDDIEMLRQLDAGADDKENATKSM
jgi:hypothetical protein